MGAADDRGLQVLGALRVTCAALQLGTQQ